MRLLLPSPFFRSCCKNSCIIRTGKGAPAPRRRRRTTTTIGPHIVALLQRRLFSSSSSSSSFDPTSSSTTTTAATTRKFEGVYPIVVTPFRGYGDGDGDNKKNYDESIDLQSFRRSLEFFLRTNACDGVTITGVLGESNRLVDSERETLIQCARETIDRNRSAEAEEQQHFDLCVGTSHTGTAATVALSQMAKELGATSVMISPSCNSGGAAQPSDDDIMELFQRVANVCGPNVTIVLQDHPSSTGVVMSCDLIYRIVKTIPTVRCIKLESVPTIHRLSILRDKYPDILEYCTILTGLGALYSGFDLESNMTSGFMTGFAFPEILHAMTIYGLSPWGHDRDKVQTLYRKFLPLIVLEQTPTYGLAIRKEIYKIRGLIDDSHVRHPGKNITPTLRNVLRSQLERSFPKGIDLTQRLPEEILEV